LDLTVSKDVLQSRIQAVASFDTAFRGLQAQTEASGNVVSTAIVALQASEDAVKAYASFGDTAETRYLAAAKALATAKQNFEDLAKELRNRQKALDAGLHKWKTQQTGKAVVQGIWAVALVAGSIAIACAAPPAGAAAIATAGSEVEASLNTAGSAAESTSKLKKVFDGISRIYSKLKPGLEKSDSLVDAIKDTASLLSKLKDVNVVQAGAVSGLHIPSRFAIQHASIN